MNTRFSQGKRPPHDDASRLALGSNLLLKQRKTNFNSIVLCLRVEQTTDATSRRHMVPPTIYIYQKTKNATAGWVRMYPFLPPRILPCSLRYILITTEVHTHTDTRPQPPPHPPTPPTRHPSLAPGGRLQRLRPAAGRQHGREAVDHVGGEPHHRHVGPPALRDDGGGRGERVLELVEHGGQVGPDGGLRGVDGEDAALKPLQLRRLRREWGGGRSMTSEGCGRHWPSPSTLHSYKSLQAHEAR